MKRIIDGKTYNTETAQKIHEYSRGYAGDFHQFSEALYLTKKGAWFLAGEGGPMTRYATHHTDGSRSGGEDLIVLTPDEALDYLEHADCDAETIEFHFQIEEA